MHNYKCEKYTNFIKKIKKIVGKEIAWYNFHQSSMNTLNIGSKIKPIDQKNSKTSDVIVFAAPFVISTNIIDPDVYISAHEAAVSQRKIT